MQPYRKDLKQFSRSLRTNMTEAEQFLWRRLRARQIDALQFYRQKLLLSFIVDFYCPAAKLVIELDGGQHFDAYHEVKDRERDDTLTATGLRVRRFDNQQGVCDTRAGVV